MMLTMKKIRRYLKRVLIALDVLTNVILGGELGQTFSARNWHWKKNNKPNIVWLIDLIFFWDSTHCMNSYIWWAYEKDLRKIRKKEVYNPKKMDYNERIVDNKERPYADFDGL